MNPCAGEVEIRADKRRVGRDYVAEVLLEILGYLRDHRCVDLRVVAAQLEVAQDQPLDGRVTGALPDAEDRAVRRAAAVEPRGHRVGGHEVKVVVAVPLHPFARHAGIVGQPVDRARHGPRHRHPGIRHAEAEGVADPDLDDRLAVRGELHQLVGERDDKPVEVGARRVLEVAARRDAGLDGVPHYLQVGIHRLLARLP